MRVLFILKQRDNYFIGEEVGGAKKLSSGLSNSAQFVSDMLVKNKIESKLVQVVDNNCIDREVSAYKPDVVVIEAFWVVPEKFDILNKLHPTVKWVIRNHSKTPFLATDGVGMDWSLRYMNYDNVFISSNAIETTHDMRALIASAQPSWSKSKVAQRTPHLPNFYPINPKLATGCKRTPGIINVGCFGAVRPLKNHLIQAVAAIKYAGKHKLALNFHINGTRIETNGDPVLKNLRLMFAQLPKHKLIEHPWMEHSDFVTLCQTMDIGLQVSYTETFNIVCADLVARGVPVVVSDEIEWVDPIYYADPNDADSIVKRMERALFWKKLRWLSGDTNLQGLGDYDQTSVHLWKRGLEGIVKAS